MSATILRQWRILLMLPRPPRRIDTATIESRLRGHGVEVHRRTIQRDLNELCDVFPIVADERAKPYGWRWADDADFAIASPRPDALARLGGCLEVTFRTSTKTLTMLRDRLVMCDVRVLSLGDVTRDEDRDEEGERIDVVAARIEDTDASKRILLGHGDLVEILTPFELRRLVTDRTSRATIRHSAGG